MYAYTPEDNFYPINAENGLLQFFFTAGNNLYYVTNPDENNTYHFSNPNLSDISRIVFYPGATAQVPDQPFNFPADFELYDYYLLGALYSNSKDVSLSSFKPSGLAVRYKDANTDTIKNYDLSNLNIYNIDNQNVLGFGFSVQVDFESADNIGVASIQFLNDVNGSGSKPANQIAEFGILSVPVGTDEVTVMTQILDKLSEMKSSITGSIDAAGDKVADAIENQYAVSDTEDFGVGQLADQVEEKLGVLSFGADTLNNFLGLFQASNAGSTVLTFPGFTINVQGESYRVWNDIQFDLSFLEENFGFLIDTVRTVTVLCVWLAVLGYLVKAYEHLVNNKG